MDTKHVVRSGGLIDRDASVAAFTAALDAHIVESETEGAVIAEAVGAVFDQYKGAAINMPALETFALTRLNVQPETWASLRTKVKSFVRDNSTDTREEGGLFQGKKGSGGGVRRWADSPADSK